VTAVEILGGSLLTIALIATWYGVIRWLRELQAFRKQLEARGIVFPEPPVSLYLLVSLVPLALVLQALIFFFSRGRHWETLAIIPVMFVWLLGNLWAARRAHRKKLGRSS